MMVFKCLIKQIPSKPNSMIVLFDFKTGIKIKTGQILKSNTNKFWSMGFFFDVIKFIYQIAVQNYYNTGHAAAC